MKTPGHADTYPELKINYIQGHNPELVLFADDGTTETERIDLTGYDVKGEPSNDERVQAVHALLEEKGFERQEAAEEEKKEL